MNQAERRKAIDNAVAAAVSNALVPAAVRVGIAALAEEVRELVARVEQLEKVKA